MYTHGPNCLAGPVSRKRDWWQGTPPGTEAGSVEEADLVRWHLVERVRQEIAAGVYDTPEKLELALQRLLERHT
jgi:hypothetical protein